MPRRKWTDDDIALAKMLFDAGATLKKIGARFGLTGTGIRDVLRRNGTDTTRYPACKTWVANGYVRASLPGGRREFVHRLVMERKIGRRLAPGEIVHHRDEKKRHNAPGNLELLPSVSTHMRGHHPAPAGPCSRCPRPAFTAMDRRILLCRPCFNHFRRYHLTDRCSSSRGCRFVDRLAA